MTDKIKTIINFVKEKVFIITPNRLTTLSLCLLGLILVLFTNVEVLFYSVPILVIAIILVSLHLLVTVLGILNDYVSGKHFFTYFFIFQLILVIAIRFITVYFF